MSTNPSMLDMLKAGVHFGHQKSRWHPKMEQYLFGVRNGVHIIDLDKTVEEMTKATTYLKNLAAKGKIVLFIGTKRQARDIVKAAALSCDMPYLVERWVGGLLTNFDEFKRRLKKYKSIKEMFDTGEIEKYTKKEQSTFKKQVEKMDRYLAGLVNLDRIPDAIYIADVRVEKTAVTEARRVRVPMVAVCDSNVDPTKIDYPIPANDDAVNSIKMIAEIVSEAIKAGKAEFEKNKAEGAKVVEIKRPATAHQAEAEEKPTASKAAAPKKQQRALKKNDIA